MTLLDADLLTKLDMSPYIGQRSATFKFVLINTVLPLPPVVIHPIKTTVPVLTHDTTRTIKRQITGLSIGASEAGLINVISSRILLYMTIGGTDFPLGRYMFADRSALIITSGDILNTSLYDEMFMVDQQLENGYAAIRISPVAAVSGFTQNLGLNCDRAIRELLRDINVTLNIEPTPYGSVGSWTAGTNRGQVIEQLSLDGDYFSPWFGNDTEMHFIRTFDPVTRIPTFDLDAGNRVIRDSIIQSDDLITAPNRFIVISNGVGSDDQLANPIVGRADIPTTAPHSVPNRGFVVPSVTERQVNSAAQAGAIAQNLALRQTVFERTELATVPDPRHDAYDVIKWQGEKWLELAWTLPLTEGAAMGHVMRKVYS